MNRIAPALIGLAGASLAVYAGLKGSPVLAGVSAANGAIWAYRTGRGDGSNTVFLVVHTVLSSLIALMGGFLIPAVSLSAGLYGWDISLTAHYLSGYEGPGRRRLIVRYVASAAVIAAAGILIGEGALVIRVHLPFPLALGLSIAAILIAAVGFHLLKGE